MFLAIFRNRSHDATAHKIYVRIVEQARRPLFYLAYGVPDSPDGRFDMIAVHAALVLRRLRRDRPSADSLAQAVFDLMFVDLDQNLREMGVGDLAVGKRIKGMAKGFYGRLAAYEQGLEDTGGSGLADALKRNVYRHGLPTAEQLAAITAYVRREADALDRADSKMLAAGEVHFGTPDPVDGEMNTHAASRPA